MTMPKTNPAGKSVSKDGNYRVIFKRNGSGPGDGTGVSRSVASGDSGHYAKRDVVSGKRVYVTQGTRPRSLAGQGKSPAGQSSPPTTNNGVNEEQPALVSPNARLATLFANPERDIFPDEIMRNILDYRAGLESDPSVE